MAKSVKRKITVLKKNYDWVLNGNSIDQNRDEHIRIYIQGVTKSILYLDPYNWHFEIRPKTIAAAILFAIDTAWNPEEREKDLYISMKNNGKFYVLPEGMKFGYLDKESYQ